MLGVCVNGVLPVGVGGGGRWRSSPGVLPVGVGGGDAGVRRLVFQSNNK